MSLSLWVCKVPSTNVLLSGNVPSNNLYVIIGKIPSNINFFTYIKLTIQQNEKRFKHPSLDRLKIVKTTSAVEVINPKFFAF